MKPLIHLLLLVCLASPLFAQPAPMILGSEKPDPNIDSKEFGTFAKGSDGKLSFTATTAVPLIPHQRFGWRLKLDTGHREPIEVREELEFSSALEIPRVRETDARETTDGRVFKRTSLMIADADGFISSVSEVGSDDPPGPGDCRLYVGNKLIATFPFSLERPDADAALVGSRPISSPPPLLEEELRRIRATLARYQTALTRMQGGLEIIIQQQRYAHEHGDAQSRAYADEIVRRATNEMETIEFCMTQLERTAVRLARGIKKRVGSGSAPTPLPLGIIKVGETTQPAGGSGK